MNSNYEYLYMEQEVSPFAIANNMNTEHITPPNMEEIKLSLIGLKSDILSNFVFYFGNLMSMIIPIYLNNYKWGEMEEPRDVKSVIY